MCLSFILDLKQKPDEKCENVNKLLKIRNGVEAKPHNQRRLKVSK